MPTHRGVYRLSIALLLVMMLLAACGGAAEPPGGAGTRCHRRACAHR